MAGCGGADHHRCVHTARGYWAVPQVNHRESQNHGATSMRSFAVNEFWKLSCSWRWFCLYFSSWGVQSNFHSISGSPRNKIIACISADCSVLAEVRGACLRVLSAPLPDWGLAPSYLIDFFFFFPPNKCVWSTCRYCWHVCLCVPAHQTEKRVEFGPDPFFFLRLDMEDCELKGCVLCSGDGCKLSPNSL